MLTRAGLLNPRSKVLRNSISPASGQKHKCGLLRERRRERKVLRCRKEKEMVGQFAVVD
jgi:hypothetical protein